MTGFIDGVFQSVPATRYREAGGSYVYGIWVDGIDDTSAHLINLQPISEKELNNVEALFGAERIVDARKLYVNDGDLYKITPTDEWQFEGVDGRFKTFKLDNRPWNFYCKAIVYRIDDEPKV
jgi:hypothetical protein